MAKELDKAQLNHLRRLLGWARCEVWQSPEEFVETLRSIAPAVGTPGPEAKQRLAETYEKAASVPKYVRAAIKALEPVVKEAEGEIVDAVYAHSMSEYRRITAQGGNILPPKPKALR